MLQTAMIRQQFDATWQIRQLGMSIRKVTEKSGAGAKLEEFSADECDARNVFKAGQCKPKSVVSRKRMKQTRRANI